MILEFNKTILNTNKFHTQLRAKSYGNLYTSFTKDDMLRITFSQDLSQVDQDDCSSFVTNFVDYETIDQLEVYLEASVFPFIKSLINSFAAENISMGITQANKSGDLLAIFQKLYPTASLGGSVSLKACFDTGSLYEALKVLQYIRDNPTEYDNMSPFITDARLLKMKNNIETFLGITLST